VYDEPGEEARDGGNVAVDALDELAGPMLRMERAVELEHVSGEIGSEHVRGAPAEIAGDVRLRDGRHLREERDAEEDHGDADELIERPARLGAVDERLGDQRVGQLQADPGEQQDPEQHGTRPLRSQVSRKQCTVEFR
jgi:hypothetical protein